MKAVLDGPVFASVRGESKRPEGSMVMMWTGHSRCELVDGTSVAAAGGLIKRGTLVRVLGF